MLLSSSSWCFLVQNTDLQIFLAYPHASLLLQQSQDDGSVAHSKSSVCSGHNTIYSSRSRAMSLSEASACETHRRPVAKATSAAIKEMEENNWLNHGEEPIVILPRSEREDQRRHRIDRRSMSPNRAGALANEDGGRRN